MRLTVLGGSAAGANSGQGCSGYLVESGDTRLVLDLGPGTFIELRHHTDYRCLSAVILSHFHADHVLDVVALRFALSYNPVPANQPISLWVPPGGSARLAKLAMAFGEEGREDEFFPSVFTVHEFDPDAGLVVGGVEIRFAPTVHYVPCWAMRLTAGDATLGYTADTGPAAKLDDLLDRVDVLIAEGTLLRPSSEALTSRGHLTAGEAGELAARTAVSSLILAHLWQENGFDAYRTQAGATFNGDLHLASRGLSLNW